MRSVHALALPVALLLALGLSACGSGGQIPISEPTKSGETTGSTDSTRRPTKRPTERPTTRRPTEKPTERPTEPTPTATSSGGRFVHSTELQVGDCYNKVTTGSQIGNVEVVDCDTPHQSEVYNNYEITMSTLPDEDTMSSEATTACSSTFQEYVGIPMSESQYDANYLYPTSGSWAQGDRTITCTISTVDGSLITGSLKGAAR